LQNLRRAALGSRLNRRRPARCGSASALSPRRIATQRAVIGVTPSGRTRGAASIPAFKRALGMVGMMRDHWWWPWWVSTLIDVGIVALALLVLRRTSRRFLRGAAVLIALAAAVAGVMAPIVMTQKPNHVNGQTPMMP